VYFLGGKGGRCVRLTTLPTSCAVVMKSGNPNFLEPSGPLQVCNGTALPLSYFLPSFLPSLIPCFLSHSMNSIRNRTPGTSTSEGCYQLTWAPRRYEPSVFESAYFLILTGKKPAVSIPCRLFSFQYDCFL
jgi:hypothetical protein